MEIDLDADIDNPRIRVYALVITVFVIVSIQMALPESVTVGPIWFIPALEVLGIPISAGMRWLEGREGPLVRKAMKIYLVLLVLACVMNAALLFVSMLRGADESGVYLLMAGFGVLVINVLSFGLVYWWLDGGGPERRNVGNVVEWDFQFPQQAAHMDWTPSLLDYMYTAYTNIIAFSPTDTLPLSHRVKILFTVQSFTALLTIVVTLSRAINLIPGGIAPPV